MASNKSFSYWQQHQLISDKKWKFDWNWNWNWITLQLGHRAGKLYRVPPVRDGGCIRAGFGPDIDYRDREQKIWASIHYPLLLVYTSIDSGIFVLI